METYYTELGVTRKMCIHLGIFGKEFGGGGGSISHLRHEGAMACLLEGDAYCE